MLPYPLTGWPAAHASGGLPAGPFIGITLS